MVAELLEYLMSGISWNLGGLGEGEGGCHYFKGGGRGGFVGEFPDPRLPTLSGLLLRNLN